MYMSGSAATEPEAARERAPSRRHGALLRLGPGMHGPAKEPLAISSSLWKPPPKRQCVFRAQSSESWIAQGVGGDRRGRIRGDLAAGMTELSRALLAGRSPEQGAARGSLSRPRCRGLPLRAAASHAQAKLRDLPSPPRCMTGNLGAWPWRCEAVPNRARGCRWYHARVLHPSFRSRRLQGRSAIHRDRYPIAFKQESRRVDGAKWCVQLGISR
jgi:hypothetical protein